MPSIWTKSFENNNLAMNSILFNHKKLKCPLIVRILFPCTISRIDNRIKHDQCLHLLCLKGYVVTTIYFDVYQDVIRSLDKGLTKTNI